MYERPLGSRILVCLMCLQMAGCSDPNAPDTMYEKYISRLSNVTEIDPPVLSKRADLPHYPATRDLVLEADDIRVGLLEFLSFSECQLLHDISERNSGLGRVQQPSVRLRYDMHFYAKLRDCRSQLQSQSNPDQDTLELIALVDEVLARKQKVLPITYWNASWASPEMRVLMSRSTHAYHRDETIPVSELSRDLGFLVLVGQQLFEGGPRISDADFEQHYYRLQQNKAVGRWLLSLWLSLDYLEQAAEILRQAEDQNSVCPQGRRTQRAKYLQNVFIKFYAGEIQPYLSKLHRAGQSLLPVLQQLHAVQGADLPQAYQAHYQRFLDAEATEGLWQQFQQRMRRHTMAWQGLLKQCGMMPGSKEAEPGR